jgi:hypothetical protein
MAMAPHRASDIATTGNITKAVAIISKTVWKLTLLANSRASPNTNPAKIKIRRKAKYVI